MSETVVRVQFGSHLYGTNTPASDRDYKAVHIPSAEDILLQRVKTSLRSGRSKSDGERNNCGDVDEENYSLQYFLKLLAEGQTVAIDMLFAPDSMLLKTSDCWQTIRENKDKLLSKKSAAFVGYCRTQANKYGIKGSRVAAAKAAVDYFSYAMGEYGTTIKVGDLPHIELIYLKALVRENSEHIKYPVYKEGASGRSEAFFECCNRLVNVTASVKLAHEIFRRIYDNYGDRARLAQENEGIDWKALSHAVRVGTEAIELLDTGRITFPMVNAGHLIDIKLGRLPYPAVAEEIETLLVDVESASARSSLRDEADQSFIDSLVKEAYMSRVRGEK